MQERFPSWRGAPRIRSMVAAAAVAVTASLTTARAAAAQNAADTAADLATLVTPGGALPLPPNATVSGARSTGLELGLLYGYAHLDPEHRRDANAVGARLDVRLLWGALDLAVTGGRLFAFCPAGASAAATSTFIDLACRDLWTAGAESMLRLVRTNVSDDFESACLTVSLDARAGLADPSFNDLRRGPDRSAARSAFGGVAVALGAAGRHTVFTPWVMPGIAYGRIVTPEAIARRDASGAVVGADTIPFDTDGARVMVSGGVSLVETHAGVGISATFQKVIVRRGGVGVGLALGIGTPWAHRAATTARERRMDADYSDWWGPPDACRVLGG